MRLVGEAYGINNPSNVANSLKGLSNDAYSLKGLSNVAYMVLEVRTSSGKVCLLCPSMSLLANNLTILIQLYSRNGIIIQLIKYKSHIMATVDLKFNIEWTEIIT